MQTGSFSKIYSIKQEKNWIQFFMLSSWKLFGIWECLLPYTVHK